jgi:hypothetical protein
MPYKTALHQAHGSVGRREYQRSHFTDRIAELHEILDSIEDTCMTLTTNDQFEVYLALGFKDADLRKIEEMAQEFGGERP